MTTQEKNGITEGVIWKQLVLFAIPLIMGTAVDFLLSDSGGKFFSAVI